MITFNCISQILFYFNEKYNIIVIMLLTEFEKQQTDNYIFLIKSCFLQNIYRKQFFKSGYNKWIYPIIFYEVIINIWVV